MKLKRVLKRIIGIFRKHEDTYEEYRDSIRNRIISGGGSGGENFDVYNCNIDFTNPYLIHIGNNVTLTNATLLTHDASLKKEPRVGYSYVAKVTIGDNVFVGYHATILAGSTIGDHVVIGAGSVVSGTIPSNSVAVGNPCRVIKSYEELVQKREEMMRQLPVCDLDMEGLLSNEEQREELCRAGRGFML